MKRLICLLLVALMIFPLCACGKKKEDEKEKPAAGQTQTEEKAETKTEPSAEEIVTAPEKNNENPEEIGTLPIIFDDQNKNENKDEDNGTKTPSTTTKKPSTTTKKPSTSSSANKNETPPLLGGNEGTVVETPIIPFN